MRRHPARRTLLKTGLAWAGLAAVSPAFAQRGRIPRGVEPFRAAPLPPVVMAPRAPNLAWYVPTPPAYPQAIPAQRLIADAQGYSDALQRYIEAWLDGRAGAVLPDAFIPPGVNRGDFKRFTLVRDSEINPETQWVQRLAHTIHPRALYGSFPDPNCTYLIALVYAPFGCTLQMDGQFPHARFFDVQISPSFDPKSYRYDGGIGVGEAPIVDADIDPLPGHVNPFRVGAQRDSQDRRYTLTFDLAIGDPVQLNPAFRPPFFRAPGNRRVGGGLYFQGPWGAYPWIAGHGRGAWDIGQLWVRYYAPDAGKGPLAGAPLPKLTYQLPDGRKFWLQVDFEGLARRANRTTSVPAGSAEPSLEKNNDHTFGWAKQVGIFRSVISGIALNTKAGDQAYVRALDKGVAGRGHDLPAPNDYEQSATSCTYIDYLVRGMTCAQGKVVALTGKLPRIPRTRDGARIMQAGEARYWSLVGYYVPDGWDFLAAFSPDAVNGVAQHAVMDEEIILQDDNRYLIVLSRGADRPRNATPEAGVTWVDWGAAPHISWTLRWMTVGPEWTAPNAPTPAKVGPHGDWAHPNFDPAKMFRNTDQTGLLGAYQPRVHYMPRAQFEALGPRVSWRDVPIWRG